MGIGNGAPAWPSVIVSNGGISPSDHTWHVYDRLLRRRVHADASALAAESVARDYEAAWRRLCDRWQQAEWRDVLL